jgi:hypothetical protein
MIEHYFSFHTWLCYHDCTYIHVLLLIIIFVIDFIGRQKTICQGDTHLVQCTQKNKVIRMTGGYYGRSNTRTCKGDYDNIGKNETALYRLICYIEVPFKAGVTVFVK